MMAALQSRGALSARSLNHLHSHISMRFDSRHRNLVVLLLPTNLPSTSRPLFPSSSTHAGLPALHPSPLHHRLAKLRQRYHVPRLPMGGERGKGLLATLYAAQSLNLARRIRLLAL